MRIIILYHLCDAPESLDITISKPSVLAVKSTLLLLYSFRHNGVTSMTLRHGTGINTSDLIHRLIHVLPLVLTSGST